MIEQFLYDISANNIIPIFDFNIEIESKPHTVFSSHMISGSSKTTNISMKFKSEYLPFFQNWFSNILSLSKAFASEYKKDIIIKYKDDMYIQLYGCYIKEYNSYEYCSANFICDYHQISNEIPKSALPLIRDKKIDLILN